MSFNSVFFMLNNFLFSQSYEQVRERMSVCVLRRVKKNPCVRVNKYKHFLSESYTYINEHNFLLDFMNAP